MNPKFKRVILKLSGEALGGTDGKGIDETIVSKVTDQVKVLADAGVEVAIVIGGGNFWRGRSSEKMDRSTADYMGMMATVINALALQDSVEQKGLSSRVMSAIEMRQIAEPYIKRRAVRHLEKGRVVIFAAGIGNPFFSTDTTAALRAAEIEAEVILLAKKIDGVYDCDPALNPDAKKYTEMTHDDVINQKLGVMDTTAATLCYENNIPILVFGLDKPENIIRACEGENIGTIIR